MNWDAATKYLNQALNILFFNYPVRSSIGVLVGLMIWLGFDVYPMLFELLNANGNRSTKMFFSLLGYLLVHYNTCLDAMRGKVMNEDIKQIVSLIESSGLSKQQKRLRYAEVIAKRIEQLSKEEIKSQGDGLAEKE